MAGLPDLSYRRARLALSIQGPTLPDNRSDAYAVLKALNPGVDTFSNQPGLVGGSAAADPANQDAAARMLARMQFHDATTKGFLNLTPKN